jgi:hypothetical protein
MDDDNQKTILTRADEALYAAKADGRNVVFQHDGQMVEKCAEQNFDEISQSPRLAEIVA